ncbi:vitamin K epoxide reductase family protein [Spongiimicrobium sp. 3-5]|uniref:vitamin K epoxide reductase family protein n=1 Tax=Spongiimicrobium sp. 3-5 TaxID=3332596 RepID=UPI0039815654
MKDSLSYLLRKFLYSEDIRVNFEELNFQLLSHPSYPSLHSVTGVLNHFNIENIAVEVPRNIDTLDHLPKSFLTLTSNEKQYLLATKQKNGIKLSFENGSKKKVGFEEFLNIWKPYVVVIEKDNDAHNNRSRNTSILKIGTLVLFGFILGYFFYTKPTVLESFHYIFSIIGFLVSMAIVKHELGFKSNFADKICTATKSTDCESVLTSKGASLSKHIKLSDLCLIFFASLLSAWLIHAIFSITGWGIFAASIFVIPITIYSIYYQYKIVNKWCPLCLSITAVLWLQAIFAFSDISGIKENLLNTYSILVVMTTITVITVLWLFIKHFLHEWIALKKVKIAYYKFKRNFSLFKSALLKNNPITSQINEVAKNEIVLGNKNASLEILLVTNPACHYCSSAHLEIENILRRHSKNLKVIIRFNIPDTHSIPAVVAKKLLETYDTGSSSESFATSLHDAFDSNQDLNKWHLKWGKPLSNYYDFVLKEQIKWCREEGINFTPGLFLNGRLYPKEYPKEDLISFIDDLIDEYSFIPDPAVKLESTE